MEFCSVETASGRVQGLISSGIRQFKGVSYGASTAGANRFQGPKPAKPWTGVRDCLGYAAVSPQVPYDVGHEYARLIQFDLNVALGGMGEDCLHLNIWTPGTGRQDKRGAILHSRRRLEGEHAAGDACGTEFIPQWPRFDALQRSTLVYGCNTRMERDPHGALRTLWLDMPPRASVLG